MARFRCPVGRQSLSAPSLRRQSPQNANICGYGQRLSGISASISASRESGDGSECAKCRDFRPIFASFRSAGRSRECLAGDAVQIALVSSQIPCKQGILQGKSRFLASKRRSKSKKPLCRRDFSVNSLSKLSGKNFRRTGNSIRITGNFMRPELPICAEMHGSVAY